MRPILNKDAIFSDCTPTYLEPCEPSPYGIVTIRLRTAKNNIDYAFVICNGERLLMDKVRTTGHFDYYEHKLQLENP